MWLIELRLINNPFPTYILQQFLAQILIISSTSIANDDRVAANDNRVVANNNRIAAVQLRMWRMFVHYYLPTRFIKLPTQPHRYAEYVVEA